VSIEETYKAYLTESVIKEILLEGTRPTIAEVTARLEELTSSQDLSTPRFDSTDYKVDRLENSSATKLNNTNTLIQQDLTALYRYLFDLSDQLTNNFDRWRAESKLLEGRLDDLSDRICTLLLLEEDTVGYFNYVQDTFSDKSKVDPTYTTAKVDLSKQRVSIGTSATGATRTNLNHIDREDIEFTVLSRNHLVSSIAAPQSDLKYVVSDINTYWQHRIYTNKPGPVSVELKIKLGESAISVSRIDVDLHMSNSNSSVQVTPFLSTDNHNFSQLPVSDFTRSVVDRTTFQFAPQSAKWVKFILTKAGYDLVHNKLYTYEFGVDEISFFNEGFSTSTTGVEFVSRPLFVTDEEGSIEQFSKVTLEAVEDVRDTTDIMYYVAASNDSDFPVTSGMWVAIDPAGREGSVRPQVLDFGDLDTVTVSGIVPSYDASEATAKYINPDREFTGIVSISNSVASIAEIVSSEQRYSFQNSNDVILNYEINSSIEIAKDTLEIWRNINTQGSNILVRDYENGWGFTEPYYKATVYVSSDTGTSIDFGDQPIVADGALVDGVVHFDTGNHIVEIHKNNWKEIVHSSVTDLATLKAADSLYPYNQRYLVEGYPYPADWSDDDEKVYLGFDIVAEYLMKRVSVMDIVNNTAIDDYSRYAIDLDAEDTGATIAGIASTKDPYQCFLVKADTGNPDFLNERFTVNFKAVNTLYTYLRLRAVLSTEVGSITPFLDFYRLKIAS
jgi:hypothetical protein